MEKEIVELILEELNNRDGFYQLWYDIDKDIQIEIIEELEGIVKSKLAQLTKN